MFFFLWVAGIAVASSLVTLGNPRKQSTDQTQKVICLAFEYYVFEAHFGRYSLSRLFFNPLKTDSQ